MTRVAIEVRILSSYIGGYETEAYNISELSRKTGAAYPHVYETVQQMLKDGLLRVRRVGRSSYCTINLADGLARNLLAQSVLRRNRRALRRPNLHNLEAEVESIALEEPNLISVILLRDGTLHFIVSEQKSKRAILKRTDLINISFSTPEEFQKEILSSMELLRGSHILYGYEHILLLLLPIQEQLLLNHSVLFRGEKSANGKNGLKVANRVKGAKILGKTRVGKAKRYSEVRR